MSRGMIANGGMTSGALVGVVRVSAPGGSCLRARARDKFFCTFRRFCAACSSLRSVSETGPPKGLMSCALDTALTPPSGEGSGGGCDDDDDDDDDEDEDEDDEEPAAMAG